MTVDRCSSTVGAVRAQAAHRRCRASCSAFANWILNTDADSVVPQTWISRLLDRSTAADEPAAITGLVELEGWTNSETARRRYHAIIDAGIPATTHDHGYGGNLAVRWDTYQEIGGFRSVAHGEDQDLIDRLRRQHVPVAAIFTPTAIPSGRAPGRAGHGLGALLARLECDPSI